MTLARRAFMLGSLAAAMLSRPPASHAGNHFYQGPDDPFPITPVAPDLLAPQFRRQVVPFDFGVWPGTIVVETERRFLYLALEGGNALRYGVGVGREGFAWAGEADVRRKVMWPRWTPPAAMVARDPNAAKWAGGMPGGPDNPLGARALYLFQGDRDTLYRIHGTNEPRSIGQAMSSGCIRMLNEDVIELYRRCPVGTRVVVLAAKR